MEMYEKAEKHSPPGDENALLRWNACARTIMEKNLEPAPRDTSQLPLE